MFPVRIASLKSDLGGTQSFYGITIQSSADDEFKIVDDNWSYTWGSGYWITSYDQRWSIGWSGNNAVWKDSPSSYIHLCIEDPADYHNQDIPVGIMTLSSAPVSISSVSDNSSEGEANTNVSVSITLGSSVSDENVYLRYTTDNWSSDNFVLASGSGTSYSASISVSGSGTVEYYVLTTTLTWSSGNDLDNYTDLMTIEYDNNSGDNYSYDYNDNPTPVELSIFNAAFYSGSANLSWTTMSESNNLGWNVYRNLNEVYEQSLKINNELIQGAGTTSTTSDYVFIDPDPVFETITYYYWIESVDASFQTQIYGPISLLIPHQEEDQTPPEITSKQFLSNYPNPFNSNTEIVLNQADQNFQSNDLKIFNVRGQVIREVNIPAERSSVIWNGKDSNGKSVAEGIYLAVLKKSDKTYTTKMIISR